jgi:pyruvate ferredoxin oxidoreductase gamma subunit
MIEILWHGRGGQGAFTAARLLGAAASLSGERFALAFPSFGPERRGAPMRAFTKISDAPIGDRSAVSKADFVIYLDGTLLDANWADELKPGGICLVNSADAPADPRLLAIDADGMAKELLGRPIPNTVFLGALTACGCVSREDIEEAIRGYMPAKLHEKNIAVVERASALVADMLAERNEAGEQVAWTAGSAAPAAASAAHVRSPHAQLDHVCTLRSEVPPLVDFVNTTCYEAGYLTQINAGWRNVRPVVNASACTGCLQCYMVCPDGVIYKVPADNKAGVGVAVDLDFCKGCGVCVSACKFDALAMVSEAAAKSAEIAEVTDQKEATA